MKTSKSYVFGFDREADLEPLLITVFDHLPPSSYGIHTKGTGPNDVSLHLNQMQLNNLFLELQKHQTVKMENQS